ncbi:ribosomal protein S18 acetylase RimI-like enzyme [Saccharothrix coeruleofusca]|uniref:GNAT family N-acetyltransferase n=1 Tax=Saccharothrix coeruleofusca TaxID=33919 RepID=UPI0027DD613B|nr:GNAT family N-acetyltransferase [Saccharothrix coeruleofusca]MBP2338109.1 ribosomal protein S18 acetylase RimI-like enzyme [Saccharothrix coeruleofusca]
MRIRPYRDSDHEAVGEICVRTADAGGDSRHIYPDHRLMPSIFAWPYTYLEPDLAFVADDGERAVGYVLGTADTAAFVKAFRDQWLPRVSDRYPPPTGEPTSPSEVMIGLLHDPARMVVPELAAYPAHLHIDLLPEHQRSGHGRALMNAFLTALRDKGVPGVHLGMLSVNTGARAFYDRLGFHELAVPNAGPLTYLGLEIGPNARFGG